MTISKSIYTNKITYVKRIDAITFNLEDDNNEANVVEATKIEKENVFHSFLKYFN